MIRTHLRFSRNHVTNGETNLEYFFSASLVLFTFMLLDFYLAGTIHFALYSHFNDNLGLALNCQPAYWCCFKNFSVLSQFNCLKNCQIQETRDSSCHWNKELETKMSDKQRSQCHSNRLSTQTQIFISTNHPSASVFVSVSKIKIVGLLLVQVKNIFAENPSSTLSFLVHSSLP